MAKPKPRTKPQPELRDWIVTANGQEIPVEAERMEITDGGVLVFTVGDSATRVWAEGAWTSVARTFPADPA